MSAKKISKSTRRKIEKAAKKAAKKHPVATFIVVLLVVAIVGCCVLHRKRVIHLPFLDGIIPQESVQDDIITDELSIHFLELGSSAPGDCTLIKTGDVEVLIDAGSTEDSASTIVPYIQSYCTGVLDYVIVTHADADHIAAFVGTEEVDGVFESFECGTIIDFPKTTKNTDLYNDYVALRDAEVSAGAKHFTALQCWNNEGNGAQKSYPLAEGITLNILYQKYYVESTSTENNNSVCVLLSQGDNHYLFTGDLQASGEKSLVASNNLPPCKLYKAGHHGSDTSSTKDLIDVIQPEIVVANCCCGGKYDFPHQEVIDNIAPYTDKFYIPVITSTIKSGYEILNGNIIVSSNGEEVNIRFTGKDTKLKDTDWFKANRTTPDKWKAA